VEDDVDVWRYAILELHARNEDTRSTQYNISRLNMTSPSVRKHRHK